MTWPFVRAADVVAAWQAWAPAAPDDLAASLKITATGDVERPPSVDVYGAFLGTDLDVDARLKDLAGRVGTEPDASSREHLSFSETRRFWAELGRAEQETREEHSKAPWLFCKSEFFAKPLPAEAIDALIRTFSQDRTAGQSRELDFMPWGGAYNRVRPDATAFVHRGDLFQLKHAVVVDPQAPTEAKRVAHREVARLWATVHPWGTGRVFPNFADPDLEDGPSAYYGSNLDRLVRVKARYDGDNVFRFDQSLPVRR